MHMKYCKMDGRYVLTCGRQFAYTALIVPLDKREREKKRNLSLYISFSENIKKAKHFLTHTGCHFRCN